MQLSSFFQIQAYLIPALATMPPKFCLNEIKVVYWRLTGGEVNATSAFDSKISPGACLQKTSVSILSRKKVIGRV